MARVVGIMLMPLLLHAQQPTSQLLEEPVEVLCDAGKSPVIDSATVTVSLGAATAALDRTLKGAARNRAMLVAQEVRRYFETPTNLTYPKPVVMAREREKGQSYPFSFTPLEGYVTVTFDASERVVGVRPNEKFTSKPLQSALAAAVRRADSAGALTGLRGDRVSEPDSVILAVLAVRSPQAHSVPLFRTRVEFLTAERAVEQLETGRLVYPAIERGDRIEDDVILEFVIGATGETRRLFPLKGTSRPFLEAAAAAVLASRYRPAEAGGCRVSQVVNQRMTFKKR